MLSSWFRRRRSSSSPLSSSSPCPASTRPAPRPAAALPVEQLEKRQLLAAVANAAMIKVAHQFDAAGLAMNQSIVKVPFTEPVRIADASKIQVRGYAHNPATGVQKKIVNEVLSATAFDHVGDGIVSITTSRMMRKGGWIIFYDGALTHADGSGPVTEQKVRSPRGLNKDDFTLATRNFQPTDLSKFSPDVFPDAPTPTTANAVLADADVRADLADFLDTKVSQDRISDAERDAALARYDNTRARNIVPDHNLRAAVVSLVGTVGEPAIGAFLDGENMTGDPYTFIGFDELDPGAIIADTDIRESDGALRIRVRPDFSSEPFQALSAILAHEAMHQDDDEGGIEEEVIGNAFEAIVWAQQLNADESPASSGTRLVAEENTELLAMLNSGRAEFPKVGLLTPWMHSSGSPTAIKNFGQGVFFEGTVPSNGKYLSWENFLRRQYLARGGISKSSAGNQTLSAMMQNVTGTAYTGRFNQSVLQTLDQSVDNVLSTRVILRLAQTLELTVD